MISSFEFADNVVGIIIDRDVDKMMLNEVHALLREKFKQSAVINLYIELEPGVKIPVPLLVKDLIFQLRNNGKFNKLAIVTNQDLIRNIMKFRDFVLDAEVEIFAPENRIRAMNWIAE
ncbi:STAS/SEC14 domain-containing protein [Antarcticibacterium arcticum]|uniref:STAS/SEC14 domain-containing protein n=1 Tax=Antarcticibacterium arcticum TaxID=2585771 RepID=A0A5B8YJW0_9FLAO|nr:STAS/SEC14 domain-containing protein [Antarcticibacterium arcticum]QED38024.1 STAS/SEC14 domain-containing protein [Antarcticibacterium arcticum]